MPGCDRRGGGRPRRRGPAGRIRSVAPGRRGGSDRRRRERKARQRRDRIGPGTRRQPGPARAHRAAGAQPRVRFRREPRSGRPGGGGATARMGARLEPRPRRAPRRARRAAERARIQPGLGAGRAADPHRGGGRVPVVAAVPLRRRGRARPPGAVQAGQPLHPPVQPRDARRRRRRPARTGSRDRASWRVARRSRSSAASTRRTSCTTRTWTCAGGPTRPGGGSGSPGPPR